MAGRLSNKVPGEQGHLAPTEVNFRPKNHKQNLIIWVVSVTNTRFFPFLDQFGPVFPVFGLKIIQKWYDFGQNSLFTLLDGQKQDFWGRMDRKMEKRFFFCPYYCIWDQLGPVSRLIWTPLDLFFPFSYPFDLVFSRFWAEYHPKIYKLDSKYGSGTP